MAAALFSSPASAAREIESASRGVRARWTVDAGKFRMVDLLDRLDGAALPLPREAFTLALSDGRQIGASQFEIEAVNGASVSLIHRGAGVRARWSAIATHDGDYLRQLLQLQALGADVHLNAVRVWEFPFLPDAYVAGRVDGSPVVSGSRFFAIEHPLSRSDAIYDRAACSLPRLVPLRAQVPLEVTYVVGATHAGQLRRGFLSYLERERARAYSPFLHYNSWYDIGYFTRYDERECLSRIHAFGQALVVERGVALKSFLFDDGWDDPSHLWQFNAGFPNGFTRLRDAARRYGAAPGAWLSPWGGYGKPRDQRLAAAKAAGYETNDDGLALSGPRYYELFERVVRDFLTQGAVNQFKIDGTGSAQQVVAGSAFGSDFEAAITLIAEMRRIKPDVYVNLTTGTYPSPFWLRYCDSIWRGGEDHDFAGEGSHRQQWITYRDADTYAGIVVQGPLYPLNSLMLHGLIYARHAKHLNDDPQHDFSREVQSYFATGTQLQEMYCTPELLTQANWNTIARWARWSNSNADVLRDTHWVGGNPERLDVYGWAAWSPRKSIITLRNPAARSQEFVLDEAAALEAPAKHTDIYKTRTVTLAPFEVRTFEAFGRAQ